jgi:hypothetical protein
VPVGITEQTLTDLFGSILRIDPRHGTPYAIPPTNPFASSAGVKPEIVAYGLRNPWRFWIDPRLPELDGRYIWSDLCDGRIYALDPAGPPGEESLGISVEEPTSFGTDATNRIYVASAAGPVYRIDPR